MYVSHISHLVRVGIARTNENAEVLVPGPATEITTTEQDPITIPTNKGLPEHEEYDCSSRGRIERINKVCNDNHSYHYAANRVTGNKPSKVFLSIIDDERKIFYCRIGKVGSVSFMDYYVQSSGKVNDTKFKVNDKNELAKIGILMQFGTSVSEVNTKYKDYTKLTVVRHPLQRVVSAYYFDIVKKGFYSDRKMNIQDFLRNITGELVDRKEHWRRYNTLCRFCEIKYDYVLKTESLKADTAAVAEVFEKQRHLETNTGSTPTEYTQLRHKHKGINVGSEIFKYDASLRDFQLKSPLHMERLLRLYQEDMDLFDYAWDMKDKRSLCRGSIHSRQCC